MDIALIIVVAVLFVGMIVMQLISTKKNRKKQEEMLSKVVVGAEIMTIGGVIGKIVAIDGAKNTITLLTGNTEMVFTQKAIHSVLADSSVASVPVPSAENESVDHVEKNAEDKEDK
mgnify:FL=1